MSGKIAKFKKTFLLIRKKLCATLNVVGRRMTQTTSLIEFTLNYNINHFSSTIQINAQNVDHQIYPFIKAW